MSDSVPLSTSELPAILGGVPVRPEGPPTWPADDPRIVDVLKQMAADGTWGRYHGPHCPGLITALQQMHGCDYVELCCGGTTAVELALRGLNVVSGDEVVMSAYDYKANFADILTVGATPVLVDVRDDDCQIDSARIEGALSPATRAILVSHLHGGIVDMPAVRSVADAHHLPVIEDACQATGAAVHGRPAGTWGDVGVLSFGGSKLLTAGRGGAVLTSRADVAQRIRLHTHRGNEAYPLSEMQAAVLIPQVECLPSRHLQRSHAVQFLCERLKRFEVLRPFAATRSASSPAYYKLGLWYDGEPLHGLGRDQFAAAVRAEGIALDPGFRGLHLIHSRRRFRSPGDLPRATQADRQIVTLHHPVLLQPQEAWEQVITAIERVCRFASEIPRSMRNAPDSPR